MVRTGTGGGPWKGANSAPLVPVLQPLASVLKGLYSTQQVCFQIDLRCRSSRYGNSQMSDFRVAYAWPHSLPIRSTIARVALSQRREGQINVTRLRAYSLSFDGKDVTQMSTFRSPPWCTSVGQASTPLPLMQFVWHILSLPVAT